MLKFINEILSAFRACFSRAAAFEWFVVIVVGLMVRSDHLGVTSIVRDLTLDPRHYESMLHFFRSSAWSLDSMRLAWQGVVNRSAPLMRVRGRVVFVGDGVKQAKEGRHMPGVKKLHQESENVSKGEYIFGHLFGAIGILAGTRHKWFCLPLFINLQDGVKAIFNWTGDAEQRHGSHVVQLIEQAFVAARTFGGALLLLDRYFLSIPALQRLAEGNGSMHIVTKAKMNAVAYEKPAPKKSGPGRPPKKGKMLKLAELFQTRAADFQTATVTLYGKEEIVSFLCLDLLWGQGLYQKLRFVLVRHGDRLAILVSTDLSLTAAEIVELYGYRFKIECTFREMKQVIGAFGYRFWSASMPKLNRYRRKGESDPLEQVKSESDRHRIRLTLQAVEGFVMCSVIATGIVQLIALRFSGKTPALFFRYLRTPSKSIVSEATVAAYLRKSIFRLFAQNPHLSITQIIRSKQETPDSAADFLAS
ncbi:transposase [Paenibacillus alvei]|uniref:transposase n=1 Tax=Paenibacillus alvei TaxID=44250 RepID=UPI0002D8FAEA|nr:transposase [Paenibacillus alvei]MCY9542889.1 transposase [Paenibacillus alvei]MCY9706933.1 transposase [Paenibacillus alvei]MCY9735140.1 transposase [Paenibacillus alvei]MCY9753344.1 transposase [Paenibacillus alvei]MEC0081521.1 transposase [Paenibacillus alvei]